jgi:hypothetical protein
MPTTKPRVFKNRRFETKRYPNKSGATLFEHARFDNCCFFNCRLSFTNDLRERCTVRDVWLTNCEGISSDFGCAVFENVVADGLKFDDLMIGWANRFKHVVLKGKIGPIKINRTPLNINLTQDAIEAFDRDHSSFYADVDWAIDISQAILTTFELQGVPADLVRRDPETQVVVRRKNALAKGLSKRLRASGNEWAISIELFLSRNEPDLLLVAGKGKKKPMRDRLMAGIQELRELGVADPD